MCALENKCLFQKLCGLALVLRKKPAAKKTWNQLQSEYLARKKKQTAAIA